METASPMRSWLLDSSFASSLSSESMFFFSEGTTMAKAVFSLLASI